jgi:hypothetical protein
MRRILAVLCLVFTVSAAPAAALTVRDVIELSKAGVGDEILLALIDVDHRVYTLSPEDVKAMKQAGVTDTVVVALIRSGRDTAAEPAAQAEAVPSVPPAPEPQVVVIDHHDEAPVVQQVPVPVPVAVPVAVPIDYGRRERVSTIITTDTGAAVRARVPIPSNCTKAEPVYWGNGGKRRPGTWAPPTQIVCR